MNRSFSTILMQSYNIIPIMFLPPLLAAFFIL